MKLTPASEPLNVCAIVQAGLLLNGVVVEEVIPGGPAHSSRKLHRGDVLLSVGSAVATPSDASDLLDCSDAQGPAQLAVLAVAKTGEQVVPCDRWPQATPAGRQARDSSGS